MKQLLLILFLVPLGYAAQTKLPSDSIMVIEIASMKESLRKCRVQHQVGTWITVGGGVVTALGISTSTAGKGEGMLIAGAAIMFGGWCVRMSAFRHLEDASLWVTPLGAGFVYKFP